MTHISPCTIILNVFKCSVYLYGFVFYNVVFIELWSSPYSMISMNSSFLSTRQIDYIKMLLHYVIVENKSENYFWILLHKKYQLQYELLQYTQFKIFKLIISRDKWINVDNLKYFIHVFAVFTILLLITRSKKRKINCNYKQLSNSRRRLKVTKTFITIINWLNWKSLPTWNTKKNNTIRSINYNIKRLYKLIIQNYILDS